MWGHEKAGLRRPLQDFAPKAANLFPLSRKAFALQLQTKHITVLFRIHNCIVPVLLLCFSRSTKTRSGIS